MCQCLKILAIVAVVSAGGLRSVAGIRSRRTSIEDQPVESVRVDLNDEHTLRMFNMTAEKVLKFSEGFAAAKAGSTATPKDSQRFNNIKEHRVGDIRNKIEMAVNGHGTMANDNPESPQHEMAAYPICNSDTNESSWQDDRNVTIRFSDSLFERRQNALQLESAILRLYKLNPNHTVEPTRPTRECSDPIIDSQIRITVSVLRKNRREKKKRICNTLMMNVSHTGWVEIDIKRAIILWEMVERQRPSAVLVGWLMIEVHDEEERPLKPGLFFRPPKCDQADHAIPWNFYRSYSALPLSFTEQVPRSPRIDIKLIGYAAFLSHSKTAHPNFNLNREVYRLTTNRTSDDPTTSIAPTDNLLDPSTPTEIHRHRQRHARHHRHHPHNPDYEASAVTTVDKSVEDVDGQALDC